VILWKSLRHPNILGLIGVCQWENVPDARLTMVSVWMTNGNIMEYIKRNDSPRMELVREARHDDVRELTDPVAYRLC